jgi:penicillin-binding protein 1A
MLEDGKVTAEQAAVAREAPLGLQVQTDPNSVAPYFVEEVRRELDRKLGEDEVHSAGLKVYTTLDLDLQRTANRAVLDGLAAYERRHGWKGHLLNAIAGRVGLEEFQHPDWILPPEPGDYVHAVVTGVVPYSVTARVGEKRVVLNEEDWAWTGQKSGEAFLVPGDIIYVHLKTPEPGEENSPVLHGSLEQDSGAEGALLAIDNTSGRRSGKPVRRSSLMCIQRRSRRVRLPRSGFWMLRSRSVLTRRMTMRGIIWARFRC